MEDLEVRRDLVIPAGELRETASRSSGPGGQHVNKASTRVTLRWSVAESAVLSPARRARIASRLDTRLSRAGVLIVHASRHRSRARNRTLARERLAELVREALRPRRARLPTRPTRASRERDRAARQRLSERKRARRPVRAEDL